MVDRGGFEPPTSAVRGRRSYQLIYRPIRFASKKLFKSEFRGFGLLLFAVPVFYSPVSSPIAFDVLFLVFAHA